MSTEKENDAKDEDAEQKILYGKIRTNWKRASKCKPQNGGKTNLFNTEI